MCSAGWCCPYGQNNRTDVCCNNNPKTSGCTSNGSCGATGGAAGGTSGGGGGGGGDGSGNGSGRCNGNLQCSQPVGACGLQSCTCYYSGPNGDTCAAWYRVGTQYFPCAHCGSDYVSCQVAAQAAAQACAGI
jgi:hypothetical protein